MPRSASTWSYNVALALLRQAKMGEVVGGYDENLERFLSAIPESAAHAVVKCHSLDEAGIKIANSHHAKVIYTWRNLADAIASLMEMFHMGFGDAIAAMSASLDLYHYHRRNGGLILGYREIVAEPELSIREIAAYLQIDILAEQVEALAESTSMDSMRAKADEIGSPDYGQKLIRRDGASYDPVTLLHANHIRNGGIGYGRKLLTRDQLGQIDALLAEKGLFAGHG
jgi:hypothetical protein